MSLRVLVFLVGLSAGCLSAQNASKPPAWGGLEFLIGSWDAKTEGGSAGASSSGAYAFQLELRGHVLARHSSGGNCKGPADFDCEHNDLLYIYTASGGRFQAVYFDNEGHVIHYEVSTPAPRTAVFLSNSSDPGQQFRLRYELKGSTMYGKFEMKMPGGSEFRPYLEWSGIRKK